MTHDEAVQTVVHLVPEMEKSGAEKVLTDYATREDLAPAKLEKLAQVYNTLRTVSHIDNADESDRGATVSLVDVPELVVGYATGMSQEKAALHGPESFSSHDPHIVDLNKALKLDLNADLEKAATQVTDTPEVVNATMKSALAVDEARDILMGIEIDCRDDMSKLASVLYSSAPVDEDNVFLRDVSEFEKEALHHRPSSLVKAAGDFLAEFAAAHHTELLRHNYDEQITKRAYAIAHEQGEQFAKLADKVGEFEVITKLAAGDLRTQKELSELQSPDDDFVMPPKADPSAVDPSNPEDAKEDTAQAEKDRDESAEMTEPTSTKGAPSSQSEESTEKENKGGGSTDGDKKEKTEASTTKAVLGAINKPIAAAGGAVQGAAARADETLAKIVAKERQNTAQRASDMSVEDIKRSMNLRRMIGTDPVLKEADPKLVMEVYNSIANRNPDIAGDMAAIRLILREAVSYDGLTLDSQKTLSDIRQSSGKADEQADANDSRRYASGGVSPIQIYKG